MNDSPTMSTVTTDKGFEISSSFDTPEQMQAAVGPVEAAAVPAPSPAVEPPHDDAADTDEVSDSPAAEGTSVAAPVVPDPKVDKRTREGRKQSIQAEIDALRRESAEAEANLRRLRDEYAALKPSQNGNGKAHDVALVTGDAEPTLEQFADQPEPWTAWQRALSKHYVQQERKQADLRFEQQQQIRTLNDQANAKVQETLKKLEAVHPVGDAFYTTIDPTLFQIKNIAAVVASGEQPTGETAIADSILDSLHPDKLLLYFTEHPAERQRISHLQPHVALREVAILEGQFRATAASHGPASVPLVASAAPPPIKPLGGSPSVSASADDVFDGSDPAAMDRRIAAERAKRLKAAQRR